MTCRMGERQLSDPATESREWEVNQKLCEEGQCPESHAKVEVKECVKRSEDFKAQHPERPGHWWVPKPRFKV